MSKAKHTPKPRPEDKSWTGPPQPEGPDPDFNPERFASQVAKYKRAKANSGKPKRNEDAIQATQRVFQEIARRTES